MSAGSDTWKDYGRKELLVADASGRIMRPLGISANDSAAPGNGAYPDHESADYKTGTISANLTGTNTDTGANKLIDSGAPFLSWNAGCVVENVATGNTAICRKRDSTTTLSLSADIFPDSDVAYKVHSAGTITETGFTASYLYDSSASWDTGGAAAAGVYRTDYATEKREQLGLRGLWCVVEGSTGIIGQKRILANEAKKLWLEGTLTGIAAGQTYYVGGLYFKLSPGFIYPQNGHMTRLAGMRSSIVSLNDARYWLQVWGSRRDETLETSADLVKSLTKHLQNQPHVKFMGKRHRFQQPIIDGVVQDDQITFRAIQMEFEDHVH